ncbi:MAG TPA: NAD(+) synthase [Solirubrobacteraceae bacterium]|nr:NAD(+) synthase [Solirubrobacteraceae bacterium]
MTTTATPLANDVRPGSDSEHGLTSFVPTRPLGYGILKSMRFWSLYSQGFARIGAAVPRVRVAEPDFNAQRMLELARQASAQGVAVLVFPELGLSGYSIDDLHHQQAVLGAVERALSRIVAASTSLLPLLIVGAPLQVAGGIFNAGVVIHGGRVLGVVPKSYLPEYREYYEKRQFRAARDAVSEEIELLGERVPFGSGLLFSARDVEGFVVHVELCEDLWVPIPPSSYGALAGATVLANLSASNITVAKADYRHLLVASQSGRAISAYIYTAAGLGESTTDLAWDGQAAIFENGELLAEAERFSDREELVLADVDLDRILQDRAGLSSFGDNVHDHRRRLARMRTVSFELGVAASEPPLRRHIERFPYVPADPIRRNERCEEVYNIQVRGLQTRLLATGIEKVVIGVSGGLDSTHALTVCTQALDRLGLPRSNVLAYTMPGFATSELTLSSARKLMRALEVSAAEIDIRPSATQMLRDLRHPAAGGEAAYDVTYENVQAGERTSHLFRLANHHRALVVGTGDLSELALGWSTYGVGDQMSHYNVNASVPKTLIQFLIRWAIDTSLLGGDAGEVLGSVLETEISPELVPAGNPGPGGDNPSSDGSDERAGHGGSGPEQRSEQVVGPFELQDFFLYYTLRFGYRPSKVAYLAHHAWHDRDLGEWPDLLPEQRRNEYTLGEIKHWLAVFLHRFFQLSQFKRSAMPNSPKVGSGGSLSPRGDWRAPSDSSSAVWLRELAENVP